MSDVTQILARVQAGESAAADELLPLVYNELRRLASARMARENPGQTLQATALVHEAFLKLVDVKVAKDWDSRGHFFAAAAEAMRHILVDQARRKQTLKRGGHMNRVEVEAASIEAPVPQEQIVAVSDALDHLAEIDPQTAELVKLRYFAGFNNEEAAQLLGISPRKASMMWTYARAWLRDFLDAE